MIKNNTFNVFKLALATLAITPEVLAGKLSSTTPNIIMVMTDDQGMGDLSCMGNEIVRTPSIDEFQAAALRFTDFQVSPTCAPTRAALMSGNYPFRVGVTHTIFQRERMSLDVFTLPQMLKQAGYSSALFGKWHLGDEPEYLPQRRGFDEVLMHGAGGIGQVTLGDFPGNEKNCYFDNILLHNNKVVKTKGFCTDVFFDAAKVWIEKQEKLEKPYFAYISLNAPHGPYFAPEKYIKRFVDEGYDEKTAARYGMIENIDDNFKSLMSSLKRNGALENTIVIFMTDNGMSMPRIKKNGKTIVPFNAGMRGRKNSSHEGGTHVPFFLHWDKLEKQNRDVETLTAHVDLYNTFAELAGVDLSNVKQELAGRSFVQLLENPEVKIEDRYLFFHCGRWKTGERDKHKYIKCAVRSQKWRLVNNKALFDIENDPMEKKNVSEKYPEVVKELQTEYEKWWAGSLNLMSNEDLGKVVKHPLHLLLEKQSEISQLPDYNVQE